MDQAATNEKSLHLVGIGVKHSIAPAMHNYIAASLGIPWKFYSTECDTLDELVQLARNDSTAGLVVTMPYKSAIMPKLDVLDEIAIIIGACNNVYRDPFHSHKLRGTNTDWRGIKGCLLEKRGMRQPEDTTIENAALIVGAGGASRAAVYALSVELQVSTIYILNRDEEEVAALAQDVQRLQPAPKLVHVKHIDQAKSLSTPVYVVGTVPDFEPKSESEKFVAEALKEFLSRPQKGVLLDMCFKPRRTRMIRLAERLDWPTVEGTHVIGYQIEEQWRLWVGESRAKSLDKEGAWSVLTEQAEKSPGINF